MSFSQLIQLFKRTDGPFQEEDFRLQKKLTWHGYMASTTLAKSEPKPARPGWFRRAPGSSTLQPGALALSPRQKLQLLAASAAQCKWFHGDICTQTRGAGDAPQQAGDTIPQGTRSETAVLRTVWAGVGQMGRPSACRCTGLQEGTHRGLPVPLYVRSPWLFLRKATVRDQTSFIA